MLPQIYTLSLLDHDKILFRVNKVLVRGDTTGIFGHSSSQTRESRQSNWLSPYEVENIWEGSDGTEKSVEAIDYDSIFNN